jgi:H+/Cl- antiporter ClcA
MTNILLEGFIIGLITGIAGFTISTSLMFLEPSFSLQKYHFWFRVFLSSFITGFVLHLLLEYTGVNKKYCENKLKS